MFQSNIFTLCSTFGNKGREVSLKKEEKLKIIFSEAIGKRNLIGVKGVLTKECV